MSPRLMNFEFKHAPDKVATLCTVPGTLGYMRGELLFCCLLAPLLGGDSAF